MHTGRSLVQHSYSCASLKPLYLYDNGQEIITVSFFELLWSQSGSSQEGVVTKESCIQVTKELVTCGKQSIV